MSSITRRMVSITKDQVGLLQSVSRECFFDTFYGDGLKYPNNKLEDVLAFNEEGYATEKLEKELSNHESFFYFAFDDQLSTEPIAYLKLNIGSAQSEPISDKALEVERFYVRSRFHRQNIGRFMMDFSIEQAKALNKSLMWLGVWENNQPALNFYKSYHFQPIGAHIYSMGNDPQNDLIFARHLDLTCTDPLPTTNQH